VIVEEEETSRKSITIQHKEKNKADSEGILGSLNFKQTSLMIS